MKAISLMGARDIGVTEVAYPQRKENEVLIKVKSMGICGSDISAYLGTSPLVRYPRIVGHEIAGEVIEVPQNDSLFAIGDHVVLEPYVYCGKCYPCKNGRTNCCENLTVLGVHVDGGMAEYFSHPRHLVHKVPDSIPWEKLAMVEPLTISMHAVRRSRLEKGEYAVLTGCGTIGLLAALYALNLGAQPIVVDPIEERLELAQQLGIKYAINPQEANVEGLIETITDGRMAEVAIEASGNTGAIRSCIDYVANSGRISLVGYPNNEVSLPTFLFTKKELDVVGSRNSFGMFPESINLIANNSVDVISIITKIISFNDIPQTLHDISVNPKNYLKVIALS